jgi:hypothetical protein
MTADASLPLQKAIVTALKGASIAGGRVYDRVPDTPTFPYVSFGPFTALTEIADEYEGSETTIQLDVWSRANNSVEVKQVGRAVREALHEAELTLEEDQRLVELIVQDVRYTADPDGLTQHGIITLRALTEPV